MILVIEYVTTFSSNYIIIKYINKLPFGIDFPASAKSPDLFDPAMIPVQDGKNIPTRMAIFVVISAGIHNLERVSLFSISLAVSF